MSLIYFCFFCIHVYSANSPEAEIVTTPPPKYVVAPPGGVKGYTPITDFVEARQAAMDLGIRFANPSITSDLVENMSIAIYDPFGAIYRPDEGGFIYFNVYRNKKGQLQDTKLVYIKFKFENHETLKHLKLKIGCRALPQNCKKSILSFI